jgi:SAM-dependent methyltransferase
VTDTPPTADSDQPKIDITVPHSARIWNFWLGGKDNFAADRAMGEQIAELLPDIAPTARATRAFLGRAVTYLAGAVGVRQFLDIGTGLPTAANTHEVAQRLRPEARIVYVDNDPLVLAHARALLTSGLQGLTDYVDADLRDPDTILQHAARTLDFTEPVAVMLLAILHFLTDDGKAYGVVRRLMDAVPTGSYLVVVHAVRNDATVKAVGQWNEVGKPAMCARSRDELARFFTGLELLEPGIVPVAQWRPGADSQNSAAALAGVGRKG